MAVNVGRLNVLLNADTTRFNRNMQRSEKTLENFGRVARNITRIATVAFAGLTSAIALAVSASDEKTVAMTKLESAIEGTGRAIDAVRIREYAEELQLLTSFSDSALTEAGALLATFDLTEDQIMSLLPRVANLSAMYGIDLAQASKTVGRSLTSGVGALTRYGITVNDATKQALELADEQERINIMLELFDRNTGPAAERMAQTVSGQFRLMRNSVGDLLASLGRIFEPNVINLFQAGIEVLQRALNWVENLDEGTRDLIFRWTLLSGAILGVVTAFGLFIRIVTPIVKGIGAIASMLSLLIAPKFLVGALIAGIATLIWNAWDRNWLGIADLISDFVDGAVNAFERLVNWFAETELGQIIQNFWSDVVDIWTDSELNFSDKVSETVSLVGDLITNIASAIIPDNVVQAISDFWDNFFNIWSDSQLDTFDKIIRSAVALTIPAMEISISALDIGVDVVEFGTDIMGKLRESMQNITQFLRDWSEQEEGVSLTEFLEEIDIGDAIRRFSASLLNFVEALSDFFFEAFLASADLIELFEALLMASTAGLDKIGETLADIVYVAFRDEFLAIANFGDMIGDAISEAISNVRSEGARLGRSLWDSITNFIPSWLRFNVGGVVNGNVNSFQRGGLVDGIGTDRSDSNLALLSDGEFVINARATERFLPLLQAINNHGLGRFAKGGRVGAYQAGGLVENGLGGIFPEMDLEIGALEDVFESVGNMMGTFGGLISSIISLLGDLILKVVSFITGVDDEELRASIESLKNQAMDLFDSFFGVAESADNASDSIDSSTQAIVNNSQLLETPLRSLVSDLGGVITETSQINSVLKEFSNTLIRMGATTSDEFNNLSEEVGLISALMQTALANPMTAIAGIFSMAISELDEFSNLIDAVNEIVSSIMAIIGATVAPVIQLLADALVFFWNGLMDIISIIPFVDMSRFKVGLNDLAEETENTARAVGDFPRGFRIALSRFEAMIPENNNPNTSPQMFTQSNLNNASAGGNSNMIININAPIYGVDDFERKIAQSMDRINASNKMSRHGTTQNRW